MAEETQSQEDKTEEATPYRLEEARKKGQVPQSKELTMAVSLVGISLCFWFASKSLVSGSLQLIRDLWGRSATFSFEKEAVLDLWLSVFKEGGALVLPVASVALVLGVLGTLAQTGMIWSSDPLTPKWDRLDPIEGLKRFLTIRTLVDTAKAMLKFAIIGSVVYSIIDDEVIRSGNFSMMSVPQLVGHLGSVVFKLMMAVGTSLLGLAIVDFVWQKFDFSRKMRMSKHDLKEETKQREGDPQIKARIKSIQMQMARKRMFEEVKKADVVVTNPTHFAVALRYNRDEDQAPRVVAKGADLIAKRIREIATEVGVPLVENPPLARALFKKVKIGHFVPSSFYKAIAEVLAFVYRIKKRPQYETWVKKTDLDTPQI